MGAHIIHISEFQFFAGTKQLPHPLSTTGAQLQWDLGDGRDPQIPTAFHICWGSRIRTSADNEGPCVHFN